LVTAEYVPRQQRKDGDAGGGKERKKRRGYAQKKTLKEAEALERESEYAASSGGLSPHIFTHHRRAPLE
jgi:hypothetical protein